MTQPPMPPSRKRLIFPFAYHPKLQDMQTGIIPCSPTTNNMHTTIISITLGLGMCFSCIAQELFDSSIAGTNIMQIHPVMPGEIPTLSIKPTDVVTESIECQPDKTQEMLSLITVTLPNYPTNAFRVSWRYTTEATKQVVAFREKYERETVQTVVGSFSRTHPEMPIWTLRLFDPAEVKTRWLVKPVDGVGGLTEEQAKQMVSELKSK